MKRITHNRAISQGGKRSNTDYRSVSETTIAEDHDSAYAAITQPQKVIVVPRYFITHWLPLLGPSPAWLVLAFRQSAFVSKCPRPEAVRALPVRKLGAWAGLSHGQIWNLLQQSGWLGWFVRRVSRSTQRQESDVWGVRTSVPVAPHHLSEIRRRAHAHLQAVPELGPERLAQHLLEESAEILQSLERPAAGEQVAPHSVQDILEEHYGSLDGKTSQLLDELAGRITQPGNTIAISHYFIKRWRPEMTSGEAWLVHLLRTQVYSTRRSTSYLAVEGGKTRLARDLGVHTRSVRRWFENLAENPLGRFLNEQPSVESGSALGLTVRMADPIHPQDTGHYERLLAESDADKTGQGDGQNWTKARRAPPEKADKIGREEGQKWTRGRTKSDRETDIPEQGGGQKWTPDGTKVDALIGLNKSSNPSQSDHQPPGQNQAPPEREGGWSLDRILQMAGISNARRVQLAKRIRRDESAADALVAWLIYGYEHRSANGAGITAPVLFALSRYAENLPAPRYISLAALPPSELSRLIRNRFAPDVRQELRPTLAALEANGFLDLLPPPEQIPQGGETADLILVEEAIDPEPPGPEEEAASAEVVWEAVRRTAHVRPELAPISLWLNARTLALSFVHEEQAAEVAKAIEERRSALLLRLPGYALQLRTLEMRHSDSQPLPVVGIKSEKTIHLE